MTDIRFQNFQDGELADIWYALMDASARYPGHFHGLANALMEELQDRLGKALTPWLEERYQPLRAVVAAPEVTGVLVAT